MGKRAFLPLISRNNTYIEYIYAHEKIVFCNFAPSFCNKNKHNSNILLTKSTKTMKRLYSFALTCMMLFISAASYATVNVTADPADGSALTKLSQVLLTFNDAASADAGDAFENVTITTEGGYSAACAYDYGTEQNQMVVTFDEVSADGVYTITFPAGAFKLDNADSEAFTLSYTIGAGGTDPNLSLIPADGSTVGYLANIIYCYPPASYISAPYPYKKAQIKNEQGEVVATAEYAYKSLPAGQANMNLSSVVSTPGTYTVEIEEGTFQYYDYDAGGNVMLPGCTATYTVTGEGMDVVVSNPNMESDVHSVQTITLTFPNETVVKASSDYNYVNLYRDGSTYSVTGVTASNGVIDGNSISYTLYSALVDADNYHMMFPAGAFLLGEEERPSSPVAVDFRITPAPDVLYTITPAPETELKTMQKFTITFPEKTTITSVNNSISVNCSTNTSFYGGVFTSNNAFIINGNSVECIMNSVATEAGEYIAKVPTNCFTFDDGTFNTAFEATFTITGGDDVVMEVSPAAEATYGNLQEFIFTFPEATTVELTQGLSNDNIVVKQGYNYMSQAYQHGTGSGTFEQVDAKTWKVTMPNKVVLAGDYILHIDANVFTVDGNAYNKMTELNYSVDGTEIDKVTVYPTNLSPITKLAGPITVTYDNETSITPASSYLSASLYMVGEAYDIYQCNISNDNFSFEGNVVTMQLKDWQGNDLEYDEPGTYYIKLGTGSASATGIFFLSDGETLATAQHIYWTVDPTTTAIKNVNAKAGSNATYNILGQRVADSQKGLVIRNGKKYLMK